MKKAKVIFNILFAVFTALIVVVFVFVEMMSHDDIDVIKYVNAAKLIINTDKDEYVLGEAIKITMVNSSDNPLIQEDDSSIEVTSDRILGGIYGVGLIEKKRQGEWLAIEPVWRCNNSCYSICSENDFISLKGKEDFVWNQRKLVCDQSRETEKYVESGVGEYRISSAVKNKRTGNYEIVYSNIFKIK